MSQNATITCNRCGFTTETVCKSSSPGVALPPFWRYVSRGIDICPDCSVSFNEWLGVGAPGSNKVAS